MAVFKRNGNYYIDYYTDCRRIKEKIGPSKRLAQQVLEKRKLSIVENRYLDIKRTPKIKFEDFAKDYLENYSKVNNKSWRKADLQNINILKKHFSGKYLSEITTEMINKFVAKRHKECGNARINRNISCLKCMYNRAIDWGKADSNPVKPIKKLRENPGRERYLSDEEIDLLLGQANNKIKPILIVALNTGMRFGEIINLEWHSVDFALTTIYLTNTKNGSRRDVPMNIKVFDALKNLQATASNNYVFCHKNGKKIKNIQKAFTNLLKKIDISDLNFHDLRHTFASRLVKKGIPLNTVRELLGHKSITMTLRYSHLSKNHLTKAVALL